MQNSQSRPRDPKNPRYPVYFTNQKEGYGPRPQAGADDYITKPIYAPELLARVDAHLRTVDFYSDLKHEDLRFLLEITENISAVRNPMTILRLIVEKMAEVVNMARCSIVSINDKGEAIVKASSDLKVHEELKLDIDKYPELKNHLSQGRRSSSTISAMTH